MNFFLISLVRVYVNNLTDLMDDEEEVLLALAEVLGPQFLEHIGGPAHALHVIKILEKLCQLDESTIRDKVLFHLIDINRHVSALKRFLPVSGSRRLRAR
jgi:hypothetical protein